MSELLEELKNIQEEEARSNSNNIYVRTLSKLLKIERESIYGSNRGNRLSNLDKVIMEELKNYTDAKS